MSKEIIKKPLVINKEDINTIAQQGLKRALLAREIRELSLIDLQNVSGGYIPPTDDLIIDSDSITCGMYRKYPSRKPNFPIF